MPWHLCKMKCALIKFHFIHYEIKYWCWPPPPHPPPSTRAGTHTPRDLISRSNKSFKLACFSKLTLTRMREMSGYWPRVRGHVIPSSPSITDRMFLQGMSLSRSCLCPFARCVAPVDGVFVASILGWKSGIYEMRSWILIKGSGTQRHSSSRAIMLLE